MLPSSCQEDEPSLAALATPTNLSIAREITEDGSGIVNFTAVAENAISYKYVFSDGTTAVSVTGKATKRFTKTGLNTYTVIAIAYGTGGISTSKTLEVAVQSDFTDDEAIQLLTNGGSKTWYLAAAEPGHLGVGPSRDGIDGDWWWPKWFATQPFEKCSNDESDCLCDDELIFTVDVNGQLMYELDNKGQTYFNGAHEAIAGGSEGFDFCYDFDTSGTSVVSVGPANNGVPEAETRGTQLDFSDNAFMGYYVGSSSYEILSITANSLYVRTIDALNPDLAWYHKFSSTPASQGGDSTTEVDVAYTNLVWQDEFDVDGAPDATSWNYDLGNGSNGWGNNESQFYTDRTDNVNISGGILTITAKKESYSGYEYTSTRMKTQGLREFTYGRIDVSAKLPEGGGTWPAIWMLGSSIGTIGWPACGEIDIMEHVGNNQGVVQSAIHNTSSSGATVNIGSQTVPDASSEFHVYSMNWSPDEISFLIDDEVYYTYKPDTKNADTWPFDTDQFIILNVAMGGSLGGAIDTSFVESSMEIDYVRYYQ